MTFSGHNTIASNDFVLYAIGCPANKTGLFFYGQNQTNVPFGNGRRCIASPFFRLPVTTTDFAGDMSWNLDLHNLPAGGQITSGQTWNFQAYFRDPAGGGALFNSTDGLNVQWCP